MKFKINGSTWTIKEIPKEKFEIQAEGCIAESCYLLQEIHLLPNSKSKKADLKHELCHVWLYEYGHLQNDNDKYHYEQVCEIVAKSNDFINKVVTDYFKKEVNKC
jgi:hypothetical protein